MKDRISQVTNQKRVLLRLAIQNPVIILTLTNQRPVLPGDGGTCPGSRQPDAYEGQGAADSGDHLIEYRNVISMIIIINKFCSLVLTFPPGSG